MENAITIQPIIELKNYLNYSEGGTGEDRRIDPPLNFAETILIIFRKFLPILLYIK